MSGFQRAQNAAALKRRGRKPTKPTVIPDYGPPTYNQWIEMQRIAQGLRPSHEETEAWRAAKKAKSKPVPPSQWGKAMTSPGETAPRPNGKWVTLTPDPPDPKTLQRQREAEIDDQMLGEMVAIEEMDYRARQSAQATPPVTVPTDQPVIVGHLTDAGRIIPSVAPPAQPTDTLTITLDAPTLELVRELQASIREEMGFMPTPLMVVQHIMRTMRLLSRTDKGSPNGIA